MKGDFVYSAPRSVQFLTLYSHAENLFMAERN